MESLDKSKIEKICQDATAETLKKLARTDSPKFSFTKPLYHYCSLETFYNIIDSNCFWLSHRKFMNDLSEFRYSIEVINNLLREYINPINKSASSDLKQLLTQIELCFNIWKYEFSICDENKYKTLCFFTCFSSDGDSLPMWSTYKGKNVGISIGLNFQDNNYYVEKKDKKSPFFSSTSFVDISYEENFIRQAIKTLLTPIINYYNEHLTEFKSNIKYVNDFISQEVAANLTNMSNFLKNSNFSYEKETRLMLFGYKEEDVKFRVRDKFIVPYIEFPLDNNKQKFNKPIIPIKSITISPNAEEPELVIASIRAYLNHKGYNINNIKIEQSTIPYKPR